jgi:hypothetical protein
MYCPNCRSILSDWIFQVDEQDGIIDSIPVKTLGLMMCLNCGERIKLESGKVLYDVSRKQ